ncbi:metal-transporting ATPase [Actinomycetospora sp. NBRC 106375]|nr:metal-transporting ATPase [Actinomycetospora sp. NBRC 106375]
MLWGPPLAACYLTGGWRSARDGVAALRARSLDVDLLMVVAALGAAAIGQAFDGGLLIVIFATSAALEGWATARTADSVRGLLDLTPSRAVRVAPGHGEEIVEVDDLAVGDVIVVRPGERVPADGVVAAGASETDQATVTGESLPAPTGVGDEVYAATVNGSGLLRVTVSREASGSVVARIAAQVEEASSTTAPTQRSIERIEQRYSVVVVTATVVLFVAPLLSGELLVDALLRAMTFMIVASPCALVLATMPPLLAAIATASRHGVLVRSAEVMERLASTTVVVVDKTGTLTTGAPEITAVHGAPGWSRDDVLALAAAVESGSEHPLAGAILAAVPEAALATPTGFRAVPGTGASASVRGVEVVIGRPDRVLADRGDDESDDGWARRAVAEAEALGDTVVAVVADGRTVGVVVLSDHPRPSAVRAVARLRSLVGRAPVLLTGDQPQAARRVADAVDIAQAHAGMLPEDKVAAIDDLRRVGDVVLAVGDGVNDAPALAAADVGIAVSHRGSSPDTAVTLRSADVVIVGDDLDAVPATLALARRAHRLVRANLVAAAAVVVGLVMWDVVGHLPLPLGVAGHEGSTILVALNGLRLLRRSAWPADTCRETGGLQR